MDLPGEVVEHPKIGELIDVAVDMTILANVSLLAFRFQDFRFDQTDVGYRLVQRRTIPRRRRTQPPHRPNDPTFPPPPIRSQPLRRTLSIPSLKIPLYAPRNSV